MKTIRIIILSFLLCVSFLKNSNAQWVQVNNGIGNQTVTCLDDNGNNIFAGTGGNGIYISSNIGISWTQTSLNNIYVFSLSVSGNTFFAGTSNGVYLSTTNGLSWTQTSLNYHSVRSLAVNGNNIFAGTAYFGIYLSTNNGLTWTQTSLNNRIVWSLGINGNTILAGTDFYGIYLSTNNGASWSQTALNNKSVNAFVLNGNNIFAGTYQNGIYVSTNNGTVWTQTSLNSVSIYSLSLNGSSIFAGSDPPNCLFVSNNSGVSWTQRNEGLPNFEVLALSILNNYILAGTDGNSVYRRPLSEVIGIQQISNEIPSQFQLYQNYPNPFNPTTKIKFAIPSSPTSKGEFVSIKIYNILGNEVATLLPAYGSRAGVNEQLQPGTYEVDWNAFDYPSGVYYYQLAALHGGSSTGDYTETKKMILLK